MILTILKCSVAAFTEGNDVNISSTDSRILDYKCKKKKH